MNHSPSKIALLILGVVTATGLLALMPPRPKAPAPTPTPAAPMAEIFDPALEDAKAEIDRLQNLAAQNAEAAEKAARRVLALDAALTQAMADHDGQVKENERLRARLSAREIDIDRLAQASARASELEARLAGYEVALQAVPEREGAAYLRGFTEGRLQQAQRRALATPTEPEFQWHYYNVRVSE